MRGEGAGTTDRARRGRTRGGAGVGRNHSRSRSPRRSRGRPCALLVRGARGGARLILRGPIPQRIHALREAPAYPGAAGRSRPVVASDAPLFADLLTAFMREAVPHDPLPSRAELEGIA